MKSGKILPAFFDIFSGASIIIPMPMIPGSWFCALFGERIQDYVRALSAVLNGAFYGGILWLTFVGLGKNSSSNSIICWIRLRVRLQTQ